MSRGVSYLLSLEICGIKNIETPIRLEFYRKTIQNDFDADLYKIKAIYGENGSGKTAVITAVRIICGLLLNKSYLSDSDTQKKLKEIINKKTGKGSLAFEFYYDRKGEKLIGRYSISFEIGSDDRVSITSEKYETKKGNYSKNKYSTIYVADKGELKQFGDDKTVFPSMKEKTLNLLSQQSITSMILYLDSTPGFLHMLSEMGIIQLLVTAAAIDVYLDEADSHDDYIVRDRINQLTDDTDALKETRLLEFVRKWVYADRNSLRHVPKDSWDKFALMVARLCRFLQIFKSDLKDIEIVRKDFGEYYQCNLNMVYDGYVLDSEFESRGLRKLMDLFAYLDASCSGRIVFIDELDSNINDIYLDKLIEYINLYGRGQLCFTAHNLSPMNILRGNKNAITFLSGINTVHTWTTNGNLTPENAYRRGFIEDSPFNVDASDFLGILGEFE